MRFNAQMFKVTIAESEPELDTIVKSPQSANTRDPETKIYIKDILISLLTRFIYVVCATHSILKLDGSARQHSEEDFECDRNKLQD